MSQDSPYAVALQVVGIVVVLAGVVDVASESLFPIGQWLIPTGSVLVAVGALVYANSRVEGTLLGSPGMGDETTDDGDAEPFENAAYRVGTSGDAWTWSLEVQDRILAIGTIQYPSRESAIEDVSRFQRLGESVPITDADDDITEFTGKLLENSSVDTAPADQDRNRRYYVVYKGGEWKIRLESGPVIETMGSDRSGAITRAKELGRRHDRSVMVNYKDGRLGAAYFDEADL
jgi:hypothetical protein